MKLDRFLAQRSEGWRRLSALLDTLVAAGPGRLSVAELEDVGRLYRRAASDLAYARAHFNDPETVSYLNQLVARGHAAIYTPGRPRWRQLWGFLAADFPRRVRASLPFCGLAALVLFGSAGTGAVVAVVSPESAALLVPEQLAQALKEPGLYDARGEALPAGMDALLSSVILTNNLQVAFLSFGLGISFGVGTVYVLAQNGLMLGALAGVLGRGEHGLVFWSLVAPHGGMELLAICLCGGSGLIVGWALISPGDLPRRDALIAAGRRAVPLVLGAAPVLCVAALVEGFVTPAQMPASLKVAIGAASAAVVLVYLAGAGREVETEPR